MGANKNELLNKINLNLKVPVEQDPLERMDKTNYQVSQGQSTHPPPISQVQQQQMQTFHQNPYEPRPISQSEMPPPPPQPQMQNQQRPQQPMSNINGNMSGLSSQYIEPDYNQPVELPPELNF